MLIVISGPSGAGKTTLGKRLSQFNVIDSDTIDDANAMKILNNKKYDYLFTKDDRLKSFEKLKDKMNDLDIKILKKKYKNKLLILVGRIITPETKYKYYMKVDPRVVYSQLSKRTTNDICKNQKAIDKLVATGAHPDKIAMIILHKYEVRRDFPIFYPGLKEGMEKEIKENKKKGYKIMTSQEIYDDIVKLHS